MADLLKAVEDLAVAVFRAERDAGPSTVRYGLFRDIDPVLAEVERRADSTHIPAHGLARLAEAAAAEPELGVLASREDEIPPMLLHPGGGIRMSLTAIIGSLFAVPRVYMYCLRLPDDETTYVQLVLEGFQELRRAARGERVRAYVLTGFGLTTLAEGKEITTPWGTLRPAPASNSRGFFDERPRTTFILAEQRRVPVKFDKAPEPRVSWDPSDVPTDRAGELVPLAFALATVDPGPFQALTGFSLPYLHPSFVPEVALGDRGATVEQWARTVEDAHAPAVEVATRRLVSAAGHRMDKSDALIDAVMAWENLVGSETEVSFRVSAALAKLLEPDPTKRKQFTKRLRKLYDVRSKLVHGAAVDPNDVNDACAQAIDVAAKALRVCYLKGRDWLSLKSGERSEAILLEWP